MRGRRGSRGALIALSGVVIALCAYTGKAVAADLFISTTGDDANTGTSGAPFKTLYKARDAVRVLPKTGPITVWLRGGTYYLDSSLVFTPSDNGTAASPITYCNFCGERAILSGGKKVTTAWSTYSGSIMITNIGTNVKCDQLFLNGRRQVLARYPNYSTGYLDGYASDALNHIATSANPTQGPGYIRALHDNMWGGNDYIVTGNTSTSYQWVGDNNRGSGMHATYRMIENLFEELNAAGEWYYNKTTGNLYFWPPSGTNMSTATIELASVEELIKVVGTSSSSPTSYITFDSLTFAQTHRTMFTRVPYDKLLRGDWCIVRAGTIFLQNAENITVKNCFFDQVGGNGVFMNGHNKNNLIYNNRFVEAGATCVACVGLVSACRNPSTWENHITNMNDATVGPVSGSFDYPDSCTISNNLMDSLGRFEKQTAGVCLSMSHAITVRHNTINGSPRSGVNVNDGTWGGHIIEYNDISNCVQESGDHGPFNAWGRDRFWSYNGYCTNGCSGAAKRPYCMLDAMSTIHIRNNRINDNNNLGSYGIDIDDGGTNYWIYKNLCLNCGIKLREGFFRKVYNNIIIGGMEHFHVWYAECRDTLLRNIIVNSTPYEYIGVTSNLTANQAHTDYNLFWNNGGAVTFTAGAGQDANSRVNVNPLFVNAGAGNYQVQPTSPALALGFVNFPMDSFGRMSVPATHPCYTVAVETPSVTALARPSFQCLVNGAMLRLRYRLDRDAPVSITLCALNGKKIADIANRSEKAGAHEIVWNGSRAMAGVLPPGSYLISIAVDGKKEVRKIAVMK